MIAITGAAGFIGSHLVRRLNAEGRNDLVLVDDFSRADKKANWEHARYSELVDRHIFLDWLTAHHADVEFVFHLGARTDTTERNPYVLNRLNTDYSKGLWIICARYDIPLIYASSAAVYGAGELGYDDADILTPQLKPLNEYGRSKLRFDQWLLNPSAVPPPSEGVRGRWGLRFFNVYGSGESHKGRMASVVHHAVQQVRETGQIKLFRSHRPDYTDGGQKRDFIQVSDVVNVCMHFFVHHNHPGIYNVGTGRARTFNDLANAVFGALGKAPSIEYVDTPEDIRDAYQYFTEAKVDKLKGVGYEREFLSLEQGIAQALEVGPTHGKM